MAQGTWVHPLMAINLSEWLSPNFSVIVSRWVLDWMQGMSQDHHPEHLKRYLKSKAKIPYTHFSMLNEIYFSFLAPLEAQGIVPPDKIMPDISTGKMFSSFLGEKGIDPTDFPKYWHEFIGNHKQPVQARLYPIEYLADFRQYFHEVWLPQKMPSYIKDKFPKALPYVKSILELPSPV